MAINAWYSNHKNFGDVFNKDLIEVLAGEPVHHVGRDDHPRPPIYACCGSILSMLTVPCIIWGAGLINRTITLRVKPERVVAVRGPKTRKRMMSMGVYCPEVYGDPALLMPMIYDLKPTKDYALGIMPHYVDYDNPYLPRDHPDILIIDLKTGDPRGVAEQMVQCRKIISSSLHGLVAADAYGIPSLWIKLSNDIIGGDFKFIDYYESIGYKIRHPVHIKHHINWMRLAKKCHKKTIGIDLKALARTCPFAKL